MSKIEYPTGTIDPHSRPFMHNYKRKPPKVINHHYIRKTKKSHNKYYSQKIFIDGHWFDSHAEGAFYLFLKRHHKVFSMQTRFYYRYNDIYVSRIDGRKLRLSNRSYRPDFVIYKPGVKNLKKTIYSKDDELINQISAVIDIKGKKYMTPTASQRMDGFSDYYHLPVLIVRLDRRSYTLKYYIKGYRKNTKSISLLS